MLRQYWDALASRYESEVMAAIRQERAGTLKETLAKLGSRQKNAADFGCGIGFTVPWLAKHFRHVDAYDYSAACLKRAQRRCRRLTNVDFVQSDLGSPRPRLPLVDVGVCVNVAITPGHDARMRLLRGITSLVKPGGRLVLVTPSVESVLHVLTREAAWNRRAGMEPRRAAAAVGIAHLAGIRAVRDGIVRRGGTLTKHYLREELESLLTGELHYSVELIAKIEYDWSTEYNHPPAWFGAPYPFDHLVVARKQRK